MIFDMTKRGGGGGGYTIDDIAVRNALKGDFVITVQSGLRDSALSGLTMPHTISMPNVTDMIPDYFCSGSSGLMAVSIPHVKKIGASALSSTYLKNIVAPECGTLYSFAFQLCDQLESVDFGGDPTNGGLFREKIFFRCTKLKILVLRSLNVWALANINVFGRSPFASDGTGGTLYVPDSLILTYQGATNWSTILGYPNNQIKSIESTHTDPDAPIDLTLYYADGTPIPTA